METIGAIQELKHIAVSSIRRQSPLIIKDKKEQYSLVSLKQNALLHCAVSISLDRLFNFA